MGHDGPIGITAGDIVAAPLNRAFVEAGVELGHPRLANTNAPDPLGFGAMHRNTREGRRSDVYEGYLKPALGRPNLAIVTGAQVERLAIEDGRATGVIYRTAAGPARARARREVLLTAGALASPQLLQLSGIGDPALLEPLGIMVVRALRGVGRNLHTHPVIKLSFVCKQPVSLYRWTRFPGKWLAGLTWLLRHDGPAASNHMEVGAFVRSRPDLAQPDLLVTLVPMAFTGGYGEGGFHGFEIYLELVGCRSRGAVLINSSDPAARPPFRFNFLADPRDIDAFRFGTRFVRELVAQPAFAPYCGAELAPGPQVASEAEIDAWVRRTTGVTHHLAGSCRMGPADDPDAVVGADLRLHGIDGLRVADASIMPTVTTGNTHAPVVMIGEKAADLILGSAA